MKMRLVHFLLAVMISRRSAVARFAALGGRVWLVFLFLAAIALGSFSSRAAQTKVWVLHDDDPNFRTPPFHDTLAQLGDAGQVYLSKEGFGIDQTIGGSRTIAATDQGNSVLVCEDVAGKMSKIDSSGSVLFSVPGIWAVDVTRDGTIFALDFTGTIYGANILRISPEGVVLNLAVGGGVDLVVDEANQGIFVVGADIKYFDFNLAPSWSIDPIAWTAVSVDVASDGSAWIAERQHSQIDGSANRLLRVSRSGGILQTNSLSYSPWCVRVDRVDDSVYVGGDQLCKYDRDGALLFSASLDGAPGWSLAIDAARQVWVGTWLDVRKFSPAGELLLATNRFSNASDTYLAIDTHAGFTPCSNCPPTIIAQRVSIEKLPAGVCLRFPGVGGQSYQLQRTLTLAESWKTIATTTIATNGIIQYIDTNAPSGSAFYRTATAP